MPSVYDLLLRRLQDPGHCLLAHYSYGPDFVMAPLPGQFESPIGVRNNVNTYSFRDTGAPFHPIVIGSVEHAIGDGSGMRIRLGFPSTKAGHPIDVIFWDQLHVLNTVILRDSECETQQMWDHVTSRAAFHKIVEVKAWSSGPMSDTERSHGTNSITLHVKPSCQVSRSTPTMLFNRPRSCLSDPSSTDNESPEEDDVIPAHRGICIGDFLAVKCALLCDHSEILTGRNLQDSTRNTIRCYFLLAKEINVIV
ncbi:hypothetical protein B0H10DRAFT_1970963 [Mycena sp. CBHHK59/15]|nr:hypothetical protein B0H10DRAFT_1970963 [Mycena sp. CBHHK59/15]